MTKILLKLTVCLGLLLALPSAARAQGTSTHTITLHPGAHGNIAEANSGSNYVVSVTNGAAFPAVTVNPAAGNGNH